jgi:hypothetical protein
MFIKYQPCKYIHSTDVVYIYVLYLDNIQVTSSTSWKLSIIILLGDREKTCVSFFRKNYKWAFQPPTASKRKQ